MTRIRWKSVVYILGVLTALNGVVMLLPIPFSIQYGEESLWNILLAAGLSIVIGGTAAGLTLKTKREVRKREGYLIVALGWVILSLFGSLPLYTSGAIPEYTDAFFEAMSGFTTTGATIITDLDTIPKGLLFWRSCTQWIGGMGMIVLAVAILPILGVGGMQLFVAEVPGVSYDKLQPRIRETAKRLWYIYIGLTLLLCTLLMFGGMSFFDSINHSFTTLSTGGFSTQNGSVGDYDSRYIQYLIAGFMFLGGTNFILIYYTLKGRLKQLFKNEEFKYYLGLVIGVSGLVASILIFHHNYPVERGIREALFQVISIVTTTGYGTADFTNWGAILIWVFFLLMFTGAMAGSTAGGMKLVRHIIVGKNSLLELKRLIHPAAIIPVRFNGKPIPSEITYNILAFVIIYLTIFGVGSFTMTLLGMDITSAIGAVATSLANIGPGLGTVGPSSNFANVPEAAKWVLSFLMMLGRLELFTVLILFTGYFWRGQ